MEYLWETGKVQCYFNILFIFLYIEHALCVETFFFFTLVHNIYKKVSQIIYVVVW